MQDESIESVERVETVRTVETVREGEERVRKWEIGRTNPRRVTGG